MTLYRHDVKNHDVGLAANGRDSPKYRRPVLVGPIEGRLKDAPDLSEEKDLRFRCTECGSRKTDSVVMALDALRVTPWRSVEE